MNTKKFSEALGEVNDKYVHEAVRYTAKRKNGWLKWGAMAACFALVAAIGIPVWNDLFFTHNNPAKPDTNEITYRSISADWPFYQTPQDLVDKSTLIVLGKVTGITFEVFDTRTARPVTDETNEWNRGLFTMYEIDTIEQYKGNFAETTQVRMLGGLEDVYLEEQAAVLGADMKNGIPILKDAPTLQIGETYLFVLYQYEDTAPTLLNPEQSVFDLNHEENQSSLISAKDIISCFGEDKLEQFQQIVASLSNQ